MSKKVEAPATHEVLDRLPAVQARVNASKTSIYAWVRSGNFPPPVKLGMRAIAWRRSDVDRWIESRTSHVA